MDKNRHPWRHRQQGRPRNRWCDNFRLGRKAVGQGPMEKLGLSFDSTPSGGTLQANKKKQDTITCHDQTGFLVESKERLEEKYVNQPHCQQYQPY